MVMALGQAGCKAALPFLKTLSGRQFEHTMVLTAIGDALVRLGRSGEGDPNPLLEILSIRADWCLADGALRATAMLQTRFSADVAEVVIDLVERRNDEALLFWTGSACAGWSGDAVEQFLKRCSASDRDDVREAAGHAKMGQYGRWCPL